MFSLRPLLLPLPLLLAACASNDQSAPGGVLLNSQSTCPQTLKLGQTLTLSLPSNPSTGYRWTLQQAAPQLLHSLGPEVYSHPDEARTMIGSEGKSTWRFKVVGSGSGHLALSYQQPWAGEPADSFECLLEVH